MPPFAVALSGAATLLAGCVPFPYGVYYRPAYPDPSAVVSQASCGGRAGPPARIAFQAPPGFRVEANALRRPLAQDGDRPLTISLALPPGHTLRFTEDTLRVDSGGREAALSTPSLRAVTHYRLRPEAWIDAAALAPADPGAQRMGDDPIATARLGFGKLEVQGDTLDVQLPAIETDAGRIAFGALRLEADTARPYVRTYRTRQQLEAVVAREAQCRREAPGMRCENIRLFDPYAFRVRSGDFEAAGRFWSMVTSRGDVAPLQFELEMRAHGPARWRFVEPVVGVRHASGKWHARQFAEVDVVFASAVPLSTAIRSATGGRATETAVRIDANLGRDERARYVITLPPYEFDGVRRELAPLEFERRTFDVGIEPFNC